ncbi:threonylcarbamoyl-AMP synthase [Culicoides brevitarsis]|uniref:threonylcarbamoyl-AMP synthase n=1 Tax=Culicoides brevitarsis TaxID=469753 RepID=UPI00307B7695
MFTRFFTQTRKFTQKMKEITSEVTSHVKSSSDPSSVTLAADLLLQGEVIALPTDTVYGLACNANNPRAIQKLYEIKGRDENKPVAICVDTISAVKRFGNADHLPDELLHQLLPGPVTLVLFKSEFLNNPFLNPGVSKIGIRIPKYSFIQEIAAKCDFPVALSSANRSSEKSSLNVGEFKNLWRELGAIFDGGQLGQDQQRAASTVIDVSEPGKFSVIRDGVAVKETIRLLEMYDIKELR